MAETGLFLATLVLVLITIAATTINWLMFRSQIDPHVIVYTKSDQSRPQAILLIIENIGKGVAQNVTFHLSEAIPQRVFREQEELVTMNSGPLITGIPALGPGTTRTILWGMYQPLREALGERVISVRCCYATQRPAHFQPQNYETVSLIEVASFDHTDAVDSDGARQSAKELKRIADYLHGKKRARE